MRKMKKSLKIIISLVCVFAVAIASVVTAVVLHKRRKDNGGDNSPSVPAYALTESQIELGKEISQVTSTSVSANKLQPLKYSEKLDAVLDVEEISYLDKSIAWSTDGFGGYSAYVFDSEGNPIDLLTKVNDMSLVRDGYYESKIDFMGKNHFSVLYKYSESDLVRIVCSVENDEIVLNKSFTLVVQNGYTKLNGDIFRMALDNDYFVVMTESALVYEYEFYDYIADYSDYEPFKIEVHDVDEKISIRNGIFVVGQGDNSKDVAVRIGFGEFALIQDSDVSSISLKNATIVEIKSELSEKSAKAELVDGKYYSYSYKLLKDGEEKDISLDGLTKISAVSYSGDKYFGVFIQGVDADNKLVENGTMVYFDYDLEIIAKYSANSAYTGKVMYANEEVLLTGEGLVSGKTSSDCIKTYDFSKNNLSFVNILSTGNIVLKDEYDNMYIYDLGMKKVLENGFDRIVSLVDDENLIYSINGDYYRYNIKTKANPVKIQYEATDVSENTSMYFVKLAPNNYSLYSGSQVIKENIYDYDTGDNYLTYYKNGYTEKTSLYFVDKDSVSNISDVSFTASAIYGGSSGSDDRIYGAGSEPEESIFDQDPEWYDYEDKVVYEQSENDPDAITYKFTHCIQNGYYSKTNFVDYLEVHFVGEGDGAGYLPYRIYYRVDVNDLGYPTVRIVSKGHHRLAYKELTGTMTFDSNCIEYKEKFYAINAEYALGVSGAPPTNKAYSMSYDYTEDSGGVTQWLYRYTDSTATADGSGLFFLEEGRVCSAEVYGNSIRVSIYFDFKPTSGKSGQTNKVPFTGNCDLTADADTNTGYKFDKTMLLDGSVEKDYYNNLYYQTVVIGVMNENKNFYTDIIGMPESDKEAEDGYIVTDYYVENHLKNKTFGADRFNETLAYDADSPLSSLFNACISSKTYLNDPSNIQSMFLGGNLFKTNMVGAQLVGITSPKEFNNQNITIKSLYDTSVDAGSRNYFDEKLEFRLIPLGATKANGESNEDSVIESKYLFYDSTSQSYKVAFDNTEYIYTAGGLNRFRYVYCLFEPQTFYVNVDYNASGVENSFGNEIDYLQSYLGLNIGLDYRNDYVQYNKSWVYRKVLEENFGEYVNTNHDKYYPFDFTNVESRQEVVDLTGKSTAQIDAIRKNNENSAKVSEYKRENERYFYIVIDGVKYYFQKNYFDETHDYSKPYSYMYEYFGFNDSYYFVAYKNLSDLESETTPVDLFGRYLTVTEDDFYTEDEKYLDEDVEDFGIYKANVDKIYIRIPKSTAADKTFNAYYHEINVHQRDDSKVVYDGYYSFDENGEVVVPTSPDPNKKYNVSETFSFLYTDNVLLTRLPQHTHYDFKGWKVSIPRVDGTKFEYIVDMTSLTSPGINVNANSENSSHPFLAEYEGPDGNTGVFYDLWRKITTTTENNVTTTVIDWVNTVDNPIQIIAQWAPKQCNVEAVLYVKNGTKYNGLEYDIPDVGTGYTLEYTDIASSSTGAPVFKKGVENLDQKKKDGSAGADGILDFSSETEFSYGEYDNFAQIGSMMLSNGFSQTLINTTGLSCQFIGWAFHCNNGDYVSIINDIDELAETTLINEYIGDTTTITIYAYYAKSRYNFFLRFHSMGGATLAPEGVTKNYYSDYNYESKVSGNGQIYNAVRNPAVYQIGLKDSTSQVYNKSYCTGCGDVYHTHNTLELNGSSYGIDIKDETNPFFVGNSIDIRITLNKEYYTKKIVFNNIVLWNQSGKLDIYDLTFTYNYNDSGWVGEAVSKITSSKLTATPDPSHAGSFLLGSYNDTNNKFSITQSTDPNTNLDYVTVSISSLSYPGVFEDGGYANGTLTGNDGFTLNVFPESYTIETEKVTISVKDEDNKDVAGPFNNNNAIMVSSQPLTNIEGRELVATQAAYIWLGTSKYMFLNSWNENQLSGYYLMTSDGATNAVRYQSYTYEQFIRQKITTNESIFVYYDSTEHRIYYPAQYSAPGNITEYKTQATLAKSKSRYYFEIDGVTYFINFKTVNAESPLEPASSNASTYADRWGLAHTSQTNYSLGVESHYTSSDYYYEPGRSTIAVYYSSSDSMVTYRMLAPSEFSIGYNNTRVLAIDPEQEQVYMSNSPTHSISTTQYDLKYYLSSINIGGTTISFNKLKRDTLTYYTDANGAIKSYSLLRLTTSVDAQSAFTRLNSVYSHNNNISNKLASGIALDANENNYVISFLGKLYVIHDAYKIKINGDPVKVGATEYYFFLTRSDDGYTKYFLIYDECTTKMSDLKQNYSIELTFKELNRNLTIVAEEEDLYDASNRSFEISYAETSRKFTNGVGDSLKYEFDYDNLFGKVVNDKNFDLNGNAFYEVRTNNDEVPLSSKIENKDIRGITSLKWQSSYDFTPSTNRRLKISAKSGYIIKYIKVYVGTKGYVNSNNQEVPDNYVNIMTFNFIDSSLDDLYHYPTSDNYSFSSVDTNTNTLISYIGYNIANNNVSGTELGGRPIETNLAYGYKLLPNETYGLYYSNFYDSGWSIGSKDTLYFDHLYLMLSGLYDDVKIEFATTSYSEYLFESGETDTNKHNPLINEETFEASHDNIVYDEIALSETFLNLYTMKYDETDPEKLVLDETLLNENKYTDASGAEKPIFTIRYYYKNSINNISKNTIRVIFFGTGSKIKHGVHFMATHKDYSVYFTNGRYYNEPLGSTAESAFKNLEAYSGRTTADKHITEATRNGTNKLVYMFTGALHEEDAAGNYTGFFVNSSYIVANESNFKFFMATKAFVNKIGVRTDSYLYNHVLKSDSTNSDGTTMVDASTIEGDISSKAVQYGYPQANSNNEIVIDYGSDYDHYQLDTTHKRYSWFNDTVLSNIQLNSYLDKEPGAINKTWANRGADNESELTRVEMGGLDFNWLHYDIPGYYLKYIMIKIADFDTYFVFDLSEIIVDDNIANGEKKFLKTIRIYDPNATNARSYDYKFNLYYFKEAKYGYYQLYPVLLTDEANSVIDIFNSVSLMSNDISVSFLSMAYTYTINFYNDENVGTASSTSDTLQYRIGNTAFSKINTAIKDPLATKPIYYDSMISLDIYQKMTGYSFIGWGSEKYYDNSAHEFRFKAKNGNGEINTWSSSSVWFDTTRFFPNAGGYFDLDYQAALNAGVEYKIEPLSAQQNMDLYLLLYNQYLNSSSMPSGAFYTAGAYFMTDTGYKNKIGTNDVVQNYNFFADYILIFSQHISHSLRELQNQSDLSTGRMINLYGIWKANTYAIEYDVNNSKGDTFYVDYSLPGEDKLFAYEFTSDKIGFRKIAKTEQELKERVTRLCYVVFDTNLWYSLSGKGDILMYSAMSDPYTISDLYGNSAVSLLSVDMFGYSWLGWYYTKLTDINQGTALPYTTRVFDSHYSDQKNMNTLTSVPVFDKSFMDIMVGAGTVFEFDGTGLPDSQSFTYYGMHKAKSGLNPIDGYVCFYDYSYDRSNINAPNFNAQNSESIGGKMIDFVQTLDYLNTFRKNGSGDAAQILYSGTFNDSIVFSYYDTFMSSNCYSVRIKDDTYSLLLTTNAQDVRRIKLFANWSQNKYTVKVDKLDNSGATTIYKQGSSSAENMFSSGGTYYFNSTDLMRDLLNRTQPTRVGYDFLGWSFNYIPPLEGSTYSSLISSINAPNQYLYLCKEMLSAYASLNGAPNTSDLESNALMLYGNRITGIADEHWILNLKDKAEKLGDGEVDNTRYVYLFPIWKAQTFSISISLNITAQNLKNLHEKDSSFAIALYDSAKEDCTKAAGVNSNYYTFNKNLVSTTGVSDPSKYYYYYNDIVANVNFEIEFDQLFSTATCSFAGRTYYLKDLMMTSAGYYFMGLLINSEGTKDYVVKNLLRTTLELNGYVHHDEDEKKLTETSLYGNEDYLKYENITGDASEEPDIFDIDAYNKLVNSKFSYSSSTPYYNNDGGNLKNNDYTSFSDGYGTYKNSSNFGTLSFLAYNYDGSESKARKFNIMSERDGSDYYLYIIHNNIKYYVVYYVSTGNSATAFKDVITSDRTYLYYNVKDANGNVTNRYTIRFDSYGQAYYVNNTFNNKNIITLKVALYTSKTNKLNLSISGSSSTIVIYDDNTKDGSLTGGNIWSNNSSGTIKLLGNNVGFELKNSASREFTLFADWEIRTITSTVANGNNTTSYNEETGAISKQAATSDNNPGLAGYYDIENLDKSKSIHSSDNIENENRINLTYDFYSNVNHSFLPFYAGRYLSELAVEFDTLVEEGSTDSTTYRMRHNTIVFKFAWDNASHKIGISSITLNGITVNNAFTANYYGNLKYTLNTLTGIDILSFLDFKSLNNVAQGDAGSGVVIYDKDVSSIGGRQFINRVNVNLDNVMNSIKFTCKYSIQTFLVEVYTVVDDSDDGVSSDSVTTTFSTITQMELASNKNSVNMGLYGQPYLSNVNISGGYIPTISTDCAKKLESYNVPFYYFITSNSATSVDYRSDFGLKYIYEMGLYKNGTSTSTISKSYGSLSRLKLENEAFTFIGWYSNPDPKGSTVKMTRYQETKAITENTTIYGYCIRKNAPTKVLFYYWDNEQNKYVQYTNNEADYMTGGSCISGNKITKLPSPSIAPWYGDEDKHFIGYVYITNSIFGEFVGTGEVNEEYDSLKYNASNTFVGTSNDIYSAFYMNRLGKDTNSYISSYQLSYINTMTSPVDMFKYRIVVHNNKYFTTDKKPNGLDSIEINGYGVKVLDGIRAEIKIGSSDTEIFTIYKDLKMLNIDTVLPANQTVYAIPIYEEFKLELKDIYTCEDKATITSNTNMIVSNVFETNANYTIYYDPRDVKVAVSTNPGLNLQNITSVTPLTLDYVKNGSQAIYDFKQKTFSLNGSNKYVYVYYTKSDGKTPFYMSNYVVARAGQDATVEIKINEYNSPLEIELTGTYLEHYRKAFMAIQEDDTIDNDVERYNRQLVIYILLQLKQSYASLLNYQVTTAPIYYDSDGSNPDVAVNTTANKYSIKQVIRALNFNKLDITADGLATHVNYDSFSLYRLAYSLAYYYVTSNTIGLGASSKNVQINSGAGLIKLFSSNNMDTSDYSKYTEDTADYVNNVMNVSTFSNNTIKPADIMASYRHSSTLTKKTIYNIVTSENKTVYAYDSFNEKDIDGQAIFGLYLYKTNSEIWLYDSTYGVISIALTDYNNTNYQEDDKYQKIYHGTHPESSITYDNELETGYYVLNPVKGNSIRVEESVLDTSGTYNYNYFKYNGSNTPYIKQGSYYYNKSSFESKWTARKSTAEYWDGKWDDYDEAYQDWVDNKAEWAKYEKDDERYTKELAIWNGLSDEEKEGKTAPKREVDMPDEKLSEPTKPQPTLVDYQRNVSSTESNARSYVANNYDDYGLTRYYIRTEGTARYLAYWSNDARVSNYQKYYYYVEGREYYKLANENNTDSRQEASTYGTGWDGSKTNNNYWLIYNGGSRIYARWETFF